MFYFGDPTFLLLIPALILAVYAQAKVQNAFRKYSQIPGSSGLTGAEVASKLLHRYQRIITILRKRCFACPSKYTVAPALRL